MEIDKAIRDYSDDKRLKTKYNNAISVIKRALALYSIEEVAFSFNGGKDSTVFLGQEQFSPSSPGWPPFMRVNPILDWSYRLQKPKSDGRDQDGNYVNEVACEYGASTFRLQVLN